MLTLRHALQGHLSLLLTANLHLGLELVLQGHQAGPITSLRRGAKLSQQFQVLRIYGQGSANEIVIVKGQAGTFDELQAHVLDVASSGTGLSQGALAPQGAFAAPGEFLRHLHPIPEILHVAGIDGRGGHGVEEHGVLQRRDLGIAGRGCLPGRDHLRQRRIASQHLVHHRLDRQLGQTREGDVRLATYQNCVDRGRRFRPGWWDIGGRIRGQAEASSQESERSQDPRSPIRPNKEHGTSSPSARSEHKEHQGTYRLSVFCDLVE